MALTFTDVKRINIQKSGGLRFAMIDITLDGSYVTGGWTVLASDLKMTSIFGLNSFGPQVAAAGATFGWAPGADLTSGKLLAFKGAAGMLPEISAADLNTRVVRFLAIGA